jgi:hypothetical protein
MKNNYDKFVNKYKKSTETKKLQYYSDLFDNITNFVNVFTNNRVNLLVDQYNIPGIRLTSNDMSMYGQSCKFVFDGFVKGDIIARITKEYNSPLKLDMICEVIDDGNDSNVFIGMMNDGIYYTLYKNQYQGKSTFYIHEKEIEEYSKICREVQETSKTFSYKVKRIKVGEERNEYVQEIYYEIK